MSTSGSATWALIDETRNLTGRYGSKWITATDASNNGWNLATGGAAVSLATLTGLSESDILAALQASGGTRAMRAKVSFYGAGGGGGGGFTGEGDSQMFAAGAAGGGAGGGAGALMVFWNYDVSATVWAEPSGLYLGFGGGAGATISGDGTGVASQQAHAGDSGENSYYKSIFNQFGESLDGYLHIRAGGGGGGGYLGAVSPDGTGTDPVFTAVGGLGGTRDETGWAGVNVGIGNWQYPGFDYQEGNPGQAATSKHETTPQGGVGGAPGFMPFLYPNAAPLGPTYSGVGASNPGDNFNRRGGAPLYGARPAAGGEGLLFVTTDPHYPDGPPPPPAGAGADARLSGGGGGGGGVQGSLYGRSLGNSGGKGGDALMIIEWWL